MEIFKTKGKGRKVEAEYGDTVNSLAEKIGLSFVEKDYFYINNYKEEDFPNESNIFKDKKGDLFTDYTHDLLYDNPHVNGTKEAAGGVCYFRKLIAV